MRRLASLRRTGIVCLLLDLVLIGSWVWFAGQALTVPLAGALAIFLAGGELIIWRSLLAEQRGAELLHSERVSSLLRRSDDLRRSAIRDEVTGLYNRWYLEARLDEEAARCRRYGLSMAVVVLRTGLVNLPDWSVDRWQKHAVDAARRAAHVVRTVDLSASIGPMEFAFCLVHCDRVGAERALERVVRELAEYRCEAGLAIYAEDNCDPPALIELARGRAHSRSLDA